LPDQVELKRQRTVVDRIKGESLNLPQGGTIGGFEVSRGGADAFDKLQEEQSAAAGRELAQLKATISDQKRELSMLRQQASMAAYVGDAPHSEAQVAANATRVADLMEENAARSKEVYDRETRELAEAAQATIKTLNEMLEQKKKQLETKEQHISGLRQSMNDERKRHVEEMMKMERQLSEANRRASESNSKYASTEPATRQTYVPDTKHSDSQYEVLQVTINKLEAQLSSKDNEHKQLRAQLSAQHEGHAVELERLQSNFRKIEDTLRKERKKSEKLTKERTAKNKDLAFQFNKKELEREQEIEKMRTKIQTLEQKLTMTRNRAGNFGIDESVPLDAATKALKNELEKEKENVKRRDQTIVKLEGDK
jgi:DNA repair exonuclease SbcCD ATPase subunit